VIRLASSLVLLAFLGCAKSGRSKLVAPHVVMPLHPVTAASSVAALLRSDGMKDLPDDREWHPVRIALWRDGTLIWSAAAGDEGGHPYRIAHLGAAAVEECLVRMRTVLERLPKHEMSYTVADGDTDELCFNDRDAVFRVASWPGQHVGDDPTLVPVLDECSSLLLALRPDEGQSLGDLREFAFDGVR
jgi:hypothetical protein